MTANSCNRHSERKTHKVATSDDSALSRYMRLIFGGTSIFGLLYFEFCLLFSGLPGMLGLAMRRLLWPRLFADCGKGTVFGVGVKLNHPGRIHIGSKTIISDNCILDGRNPDSGEAIIIGNSVMMSYGVMLSSKGGCINIGDHVGIGAYTIISSTDGNPVVIGRDSVIGPHCYITGGGNYNTERIDIPISQQGGKKMGGTCLGNGVWMGVGSNVLGGVAVGHDCIIGANATVTSSIPDWAVSVGTPARVIRQRNGVEEN